jgi:hypothetical protein
MALILINIEKWQQWPGRIHSPSRYRMWFLFTHETSYSLKQNFQIFQAWTHNIIQDFYPEQWHASLFLIYISINCIRVKYRCFAFKSWRCHIVAYNCDLGISHLCTSSSSSLKWEWQHYSFVKVDAHKTFRTEPDTY